MIRELINSLQNEKKKRRRGKRLNLLGKEDFGPIFYSLTKVEAARQY